MALIDDLKAAYDRLFTNEKPNTLVQMQRMWTGFNYLNQRITDEVESLSSSSSSGAGDDLTQVLTNGNDAGGLDITNLANISDSTANISIDIENRQLINATGGVWTIDWDAMQLSDAAGQLSVDWSARELTDNTLNLSVGYQNRRLYDSLGAVIFDWENFSFNTLAGGGTQMVVVDNTGAISAAAIVGGESLAATLAIGNTTSGTDIVVSAGDEIIITDATASRIAGIGASKEVDSLDTATYPSLTELAYVKGVTSAIQTQLDNKRGTPNVLFQSVNPGSGTTRYFGYNLKQPSNVAGENKIYFTRACEIKASEVYLFAAGTAGSNENISIYIRLNNTTDYLVATVGAATAERRFTNSAMSVPITTPATDYIEYKVVYPTWATPPTTVTCGGYFEII